MVVPRHRNIRQPTFIVFVLEIIARVILHEESNNNLSEEEYINWFLHRLFTFESFVEIIAFSIVCFWSGGGLLFFSLIFCHFLSGLIKLRW
ncbi:hypothetical protein GCK72_006119 [Caenorhabditis remanei]|uniref:Uncharacterized protein n=1 Tax=Caenorhabditis remanei TaxID=31234 RepID=A0A6A5HIF2_CAERE|nr:hypothetical protein GCK72_006119 [Caenorhabditis remanei]KAF1766163.1 hypothetical protein GCK72_006119 [Caenorhabditis remanei]